MEYEEFPSKPAEYFSSMRNLLGARHHLLLILFIYNMSRLSKEFKYFPNISYSQ